MTSAKDEKIIKELRSKPENKKCMDCTATFPTYVVLDFGTWVCTTCSGIHREFSHKVKSPTMATFKPEETQIIQQGGNEIARKKWRARWTSSSFPEPESGDVHRIREFIKQTYKEKKWFDASGTSSNNTNPHTLTSSSSSASLPKPTAPPATIRHEPKSLIDFDFDVIPNNPPPNNNMYMTPPSNTTNPFGNPFQTQPINNTNNGLDSMFSNLHVSPNPTNPFATPVNNNTAPMYDPKMYPPFMPNNNMAPNTNPFPVNTAPTNPFSTTQPLTTSNNSSTFDFDSLAQFTSTTPSNPNNASLNTSNNATIRPPPATIRQSAPPKEAPKPQDDTPRCPICNIAFDMKKMSNAEINVHVDNCLSNGTPEDSWAEWFNLARMEWYFGDIDRKEAEKILFRCTHDSFLVRKSSVKDAFAVSLYNHKKQTVVHSLIEKRSNGWAFQDTYRIYPTLVAVISDSPECKGLVPPPK